MEVNGDVSADVGQMAKLALEKLQEQGQLIALLQAQVEFQSDQIASQEKLIRELTQKVNELCTNAKNPKSEGTDGTEKKEEEGGAGGIWKETKNLSLADAVKETAELTLMTNSGFVFDTASGLYCNYSTGYYYDPAQGLYYNGHTGVYYTYNADTQEYKFHSQVKLPQTSTKSNKSRKGKSGKKESHIKTDNHVNNDKDSTMTTTTTMTNTNTKDKPANSIPVKQKASIVEKKAKEPKAKTEIAPEDVEEGELSDSSSDSGQDEGMENDDCEMASGSDLEEGTSEEAESEEYPPCIRAIVLESSSEEIKKGSLFLVTCMGGTIGSEGLHHAIILPDSEVNKSHAKIQYMPDPNITEKKSEKYFIVDEGTRTGTFLNGRRISDEKVVSDPQEILHGSILKIGGFSILMHIHPGSFTCGHCEPGLLMQPDQVNGSSVTTTLEKGKSRNAMMRQIKKKYGINGPKHVVSSSETYTDRAQERRITKGSDNPFEKTQVATLDESIGKSNKGFKMLAKMGWSAGKSLGQTGEQGILEPIKLELKSDRGGLGLCSGDVPGTAIKTKHATPKSKQSRMDQLAITMKRFKEADSSAGAKNETDAEPRGNPHRMDCDNNENSS